MLKIKKYFILSSFIFLLVAQSCIKSIDEKNKKAAKEGLEKQEIKQVKDADIIAAAYDRGREIADASQKALASKLKFAIESEGVGHAIEFCNVTAYPLVDSLSKAYKASVKRVSLRLRNPEDTPDDLETEILQAYQYNLDNNMDVNDNVQMLDEGDQLLYTKPIILNNSLCLNCHGEVGDEISPEDYKIIKELYPEDDAAGHEVGDLRGMWSIRLSKKDIVKSL